MELVEKVKKAGIVGAGGAGFPTHVKFASRPEYLIVNGAECEPLVRVDKEITAHYTKELLWGLDKIKNAIGAEHAVFALKRKHTETIEIIQNELVSFPGIELFFLQDIYPAGDEQVLVYEITKRIVPEGGIPIQVGCVVINVETLLNVYNCLFNDQPLTDKYVTVTGAVRDPSTVRIPIGVPFQDVIEICGGPTLDDFVTIEGGPMMGNIIDDISDPITKTTKALILLPSDHPWAISKRRKMSEMLKIAKTACCHCMLCTDVCPRELLGHSIHPDKIMRIASYNKICSKASDVAEVFLCCECGLCEIACVMNLQPWKLNKELKVGLIAAGMKNPYNSTPKSVHPFREYRKFPMKKLISSIGLSQYDFSAHLKLNLIKDIKSVSLKLKQSAGEPAKPLVAIGDTVLKGDIIADVANDKLGSRLHASIAGTITHIDENLIKIVSC